MHEIDAIKEVAAALQQHDLLPATTQLSYAEMHRNIADRINVLITADFPRFISVLYRLDIPEKKLNGILSSEKNIPAGNIIATLILERQLEKIKSRRTYKSNNSCDEEKW